MNYLNLLLNGENLGSLIPQVSSASLYPLTIFCPGIFQPRSCEDPPGCKRNQKNRLFNKNRSDTPVFFDKTAILQPVLFLPLLRHPANLLCGKLAASSSPTILSLLLPPLSPASCPCPFPHWSSLPG